jgi:hypothetical protein
MRTEISPHPQNSLSITPEQGLPNEGDCIWVWHGGFCCDDGQWYGVSCGSAYFINRQFTFICFRGDKIVENVRRWQTREGRTEKEERENIELVMSMVRSAM